MKLELALQLLRQSGQSLPQGLVEGSPEWMQALVDALCEMSSRDALTGLANRRHFEMTLDSEIDRVARAGEPALVLLLDIDHFKQVNDGYGHAAGDRVLQGVAGVLRECMRPMDTVARIGGEEFAAILPNCRPAFGQAVAERILKRVANRAIEIAPGQVIRVTVSAGGAYAPQWVRSSTKLWVERADQQLYRAKAEGRNRACLEQPAVSVVSPEEKGLLFALSPAPIRHV